MIFKNTKHWCFLLLLTTIIVFCPTFFNDFQNNWDDQWMLLNNPFVLDFTWDSINYHLISFYHGQYSPVNTILYGVIYKLVGFNPGVYHGVCLLIHILNVFLTFLIVKACVSKVKPGFNNQRLNVYASVVALLFAIHPLQVESVAWISASKVVLYGFFTLICLWMYIRYMQSGRWIWYVGVILSYVLGFGSKEQAILLPVLLLAVDWLYGRLKSFPLTVRAITNKVYLEKIPFFLLAAAMWYFSWQNNLGDLSIENSYPIHQRLLFAMHSLMQYIFRFVAPVKLYYFYFYPINIGESLPLEYWFYLVLVLMVILFVWENYRKRNFLVVFGTVFFVLNLLLVLHIIPMPRKMITADRYMYLSVIGIALVLIWLLDNLHQRFIKYRWLTISLISIFVLSISIQSFLRTSEWKDSTSVKRNIQELIKQRQEKQEAIVNNPLNQMSNEKE